MSDNVSYCKRLSAQCLRDRMVAYELALAEVTVLNSLAY